jgi:uncharacterized protein YutE (UPF0331/DUF86 family)
LRKEIFFRGTGEAPAGEAKGGMRKGPGLCYHIASRIFSNDKFLKRGNEPLYFVDRKKIEETLLYMEKQLETLSSIRSPDKEIEKAALERIVLTLIDSFLDAGNALIDGFIMRDPGSYNDIVDILADEKVITKKMAEDFKSVIPMRKTIMQEYLAIDHGQMHRMIRQAAPSFAAFPDRVRDYLKHGSGPVSAFKNE